MARLLGLQRLRLDLSYRLETVERRDDLISCITWGGRVRKKDAPRHATVDDGQDRASIRNSAHHAIPRVAVGPAPYEPLFVDRQRRSIEQFDRQRRRSSARILVYGREVHVDQL